MNEHTLKRYIVEAPPEITPGIARNRLREINTLLCSTLISTLRLGPQPAMNVLLDLARDIREYDGAILYVIDPDDQTVLASVSRGLFHNPGTTQFIENGNLFLDWTIQTGKSFLVPSTNGNREVDTTLKQFESRSFLSVPCFTNTSLSGTMQFFNRQTGFFHPDDVRLFLLLSIQAEEIFRDIIAGARRNGSDATTSLFDRTPFFEELKKELERSKRSGKGVSILRYSTSCTLGEREGLGHRSLERLLTELQEFTRPNLRPMDFMARYDMKEVFILLPETGAADVRRVTRRLRSRIEKSFRSTPDPLVPLEESAIPQIWCDHVTLPPDSDASPETIDRLFNREQETLYLSPSEVSGDVSEVSSDAPSIPPDRSANLPEVEKMSLASNTCFSIEQLYDFMLVVASECLQAGRGSLVLVDETGRENSNLKLQAVVGISPEACSRGMALDLSSGVLAHVRETKEAFVTQDIHRDHPDLASSRAGQYRHPSCLSAPIIHRGALIGVFSFSNRSGTQQCFDETDILRLEPILHASAEVLGESSRFETIQKEFLDLIVLTLVRMSEARLPWRSGHAWRVSMYAEEIARALGLPSNEVSRVKRAALIHDIGMIGVSPDVLDKREGFSFADRETTSSHAVLGWRLLSTLPCTEDDRSVVLHHHERLDGSGYPDGLIGDEIPLSARIVGAADAFDAMTSDRPHRAARSPSDVMTELKGMAGSQLDPAIVSLLPDIIRLNH